LQVIDLFNELKNGEKTIIVVTHDDYLIALADKVILFDQGKIIEQERDLN
jgi:ABC-type lipoprotein export system ATPase subunit